MLSDLKDGAVPLGDVEEVAQGPDISGDIDQWADPPSICLACQMKAWHHPHWLTQQIALSIYYLPGPVLGAWGWWGLGSAMKEKKMEREWKLTGSAYYRLSEDVTVKLRREEWLGMSRAKSGRRVVGGDMNGAPEASRSLALGSRRKAHVAVERPD